MRDTDTDWRIISETEPYFGILANDSYLQKNLTSERIDAFYESGVQDIVSVVGKLRSMFGDFTPKRALDFGCGVGRQTFAMAKYADEVVGVDIAPTMLTLAKKRCNETANNNVTFQQEIPIDSCDWINSQIVFQHIPPERGYTVLAGLLSVLDPGGFVSLHFSFFRDTSRLMSFNEYTKFCSWDGERARTLTKAVDGEPGGMRMFDYDLNRVMAYFVMNGICTFQIVHTSHGGNHGGLVLGRRAKSE